MIGKKDFIEAIGKPDAEFCRSVEEALDMVRARAAREEARKPRRYHMILPVMAAAAIFIVFMGVALRGGLAPRVDHDQGNGVLAQPRLKASATAAAENTPQPTLEAEMPVVTAQPASEDVLATAEPTPPAETVGTLNLYNQDVIDKLVAQFDGNLSALYAGYYIGHTSYEVIGGDKECVARWLTSELNGEIAPLWIAVDETPEFLPEYFTEASEPRDYYTVTIDVPESKDAIARYVSTASEINMLIYECSLERIPEMLGDEVVTDGDLTLTGIRFYLDEELTLKYCEMYFGGDVQSYLLWEYAENEFGDISYTLHIDTYGETKFFDPFGDVQQMETETEHSVLPDALAKIGEALGFPDIGVIGGADGPTNITVGTSTVSAAAMPEAYYALFYEATGQEISGLWPEAYLSGSQYGTAHTRGGEYPCEYWVMTGDDGEFTPAWVTYGEVMEADAENGSYVCPALSVVMPEDAEQIDEFMQGAEQWLYDAYFKSRDKVCEMQGDPLAMYNGWELAGMKLTFDSENCVSMCEFFFGGEDVVYLLWTRSGDGLELSNEFVDAGSEYFSEYFGDPAAFTLPDDKLMFEYAFGQSVDALYPGNDGVYMHGDADYVEVFAEYGADSELAWSLSRGKLWDAQYDDGDDYVSVNAYVPDDARLTEDFMSNAPAWLSELYYDTFGADASRPLSNVIVTFTSGGEPYACEMIFGDTDTAFYRWMPDASGEPVLVESGGSHMVE